MTTNDNFSLYHYTSFSSLLGILESGEIWLSNLKSMNDKSEIIHHISNMKRAINEMMIKDNLVSKEFVERRDYVFNLADEYYSGGKAFALCFTTENDAAAQWERYGAKGRGVSIEFDKRELDDYRKRKYPLFFVNEVFYQNEIPNYDVHLNMILEYIKTGISRLPGEEVKIEDLAFNLINSSIVYKHNSFKHEYEYRLVVFYTETLKQYAENEFSKIIIVSTKDSLKEVLKINIGIDSLSRLIKSITIGPMSQQDEGNLELIINSITTEGSSIKIFKSVSPLRIT